MSESDGSDVRRRWDRLDEALARLHRCTSMEELNAQVTDLALAGCSAGAVTIGEMVGGVWTSRWQAVGPDADCGPQVAMVPVRGHRVVFGSLRVTGRVVDPEVVEAFADALGSMWSLLSSRARAEQQSRWLSRLRGALGGPASQPIELVDTVAGPHPKVDVGRISSALTARQREVLDLMVAGLSNAAIAERLVVSVPTVKSHVRAVLRACDAVNRAEAIARVAQADRGIILLSDEVRPLE